jgi:hypothetical protein
LAAIEKACDDETWDRSTIAKLHAIIHVSFRNERRGGLRHNAAGE